MCRSAGHNADPAASWKWRSEMKKGMKKLQPSNNDVELQTMKTYIREKQRRNEQRTNTYNVHRYMQIQTDIVTKR